jgi:hypothetical protein
LFDRRQLRRQYDVIGAAIPLVLLELTRILSGQVVEMVDGRRQPVAFATVSVGGYQDFSTDLGWPSPTRARTPLAATSSADSNPSRARRSTSQTRFTGCSCRTWRWAATLSSTSN